MVTLLSTALLAIKSSHGIRNSYRGANYEINHIDYAAQMISDFCVRWFDCRRCNSRARSPLKFQKKKIDDSGEKNWPKYNNNAPSLSLTYLHRVFFSFFQLIWNAGIRLLCLINDAKNPRRHKILLPHRKHSPKSTMKPQRRQTSAEHFETNYFRSTPLCAWSDVFMRAFYSIGKPSMWQ